MYYLLADHAWYHISGEQLLAVAAILGIPTALWKLGWIKRPLKWLWRRLFYEPVSGWGTKVVGSVVEVKTAEQAKQVQVLVDRYPLLEEFMDKTAKAQEDTQLNQANIMKMLENLHECIDRRSTETHAAIDKLTAYSEEVLAEALGARDRIRQLYRALDIPVFETDAKGFSTYVNPALTSIMGLGADESLGEGWMSAIHEDDLDRTVKAWQHAVENSTDFSSIFRIRNFKTGAVTQVKSLARPLYNSQKDVVGWVGTLDYVVNSE